MPSLQDFKNAIGERFRLLNNGYTGKFAETDIIIAVDENTEEVEGEKFIAHYTECRFIHEQPEQLKKETKPPPPATGEPLTLF